MTNFKMRMELSEKEIERYSRHLILSEIGRKGQLKLKSAKVLVIGAGGLAAPLLQYLGAAGVGTIGIVDFDRIDFSNLQRQVLYAQNDVGRLKVEVAKERLMAQNPFININTYPEAFTSDNGLEIASAYDLIVDGTDNFPTRYLVNDVAVLLNIPNVYGAILKFNGQVSVFNFKREDEERGPNYRDLYPMPPDPSTVNSCEEAGVFGVLPGMIGAMQANEVIKIITGIGELLSGKLFLFDALKFESKIIKIKKNPNSTEITELEDYERFCGFGRQSQDIKNINKDKLNKLLMKKEVQLIDVRELNEYEQFNLGGTLIPKDEILMRLDEISKISKVVFCCQSGKRSEAVIELLQTKFGFKNLYNLEGGLAQY